MSQSQLFATAFLVHSALSSYVPMDCYSDKNYANDYLEFHNNMQTEYFMNGIEESVFDDNSHVEDRRWKWRYCRQQPTPFISQFTMSITSTSHPFVRDCAAEKNDSAIIGGYSWFSSTPQDRRWEWDCGVLEASKYRLADCFNTGYMNALTQYFQYFCPNDGVIRVIYTETQDPAKDDRRWGFICCNVIYTPTPSEEPTNTPTQSPSTTFPSNPPSLLPTQIPSMNPTYFPTSFPTAIPTVDPIRSQNIDPTNIMRTEEMQNTAENEPSDEHDEVSNILMLVAFIVGVVLIPALCCIIIVLWCATMRKKRKLKKEVDQAVRRVQSDSQNDNVSVDGSNLVAHDMFKGYTFEGSGIQYAQGVVGEQGNNGETNDAQSSGKLYGIKDDEFIVCGNDETSGNDVQEVVEEQGNNDTMNDAQNSVVIGDNETVGNSGKMYGINDDEFIVVGDDETSGN